MNVLLVSQCSKNALKETRRILDQFAERRGERTWQTPITRQGLDTLHRMLRKTARRNTAVACHWIRGKDHSELIWLVGDARRFNTQGAIPTNTTGRDILRGQEEDDWHTAEEIRLLSALAALFHDLGKANDFFQEKLRSKKPLADPYRHEWVSLRLFTAFVGKDDDEGWLTRLKDLSDNADTSWLDNLICDGPGTRHFSPFSRHLPPLAQIVGWLIVSHHRLPTDSCTPKEELNGRLLKRLPLGIYEDWCGARTDAKDSEIDNCWRFSKGLPWASRHWKQHVSRIAGQIRQRSGMIKRGREWLDNPYLLHLARLGLMLADHHYSSQPSRKRYGDTDFPLYANSEVRNGGRVYKQRLDEHLIGVEVNTSRLIRILPRLAQLLPRIARHRGFRRRSRDQRFRWQDRAFDLAASLQPRSEQQGFFGVNMASTGCGKTLANGRIMYALADPQRGARFNIALGLRTLTLQTGDAYRQQLGLGEEDLAVLVGGGPIRELHEQQGNQQQNGSESAATLLPEQDYVHFEGSLEDGPLKRWLGNNPKAEKLLYAPILTCTIDHLVPATDATRGGHQIAPMLRLLSSDLVLDEPDDFGTEDLPALARLVNWAGMLGSRVLLSSATLPPAIIQGLFDAYLAGRKIYQRNRGGTSANSGVCCGWFDEFGCDAGDYHGTDDYLSAHQRFVNRRVKKLAHKADRETRRKAQIVPLSIHSGQPRDQICSALAGELRPLISRLHRDHAMPDPVTGKRVSIGLIRMANINPLVDTAIALLAQGAEADSRIHLCIYHSQHPLLVRSGIEQRLDRLLNRKAELNLFEDPEVRGLLDQHSESNQVFIVLATAVAEVGRDHCYDWGIVEPSSMRSIIQLAGRIRRHRPGSVTEPNLYLLDTNVRHLQHGLQKPAFCRPGFEHKQLLLQTHRLQELLSANQLAMIDARPRIQERTEPTPSTNLVDLEHAHLRALMQGETDTGKLKLKPVHWWWTTRGPLSGELQRAQPFRHDPEGRQRYLLLLDDDDKPSFRRLDKGNSLTEVNSLREMVKPAFGPRIQFWGESDYLRAVETLSERMGLEPSECTRRFGIIDLPVRGAEKPWRYHPALGFSRN